MIKKMYPTSSRVSWQCRYRSSCCTHLCAETGERLAIDNNDTRLVTAPRVRKPASG